MATRLAKSGALACVAGWLCFLLFANNLMVTSASEEVKCIGNDPVPLVAKYKQIMANASAGSPTPTHKWSSANYDLLDQCYPLPGCGEFKSYRLKFFCADADGDNKCEDSELLVCHRSVLGPKAIPEEEQLSKEGKEPGFKAPGTKWIQNDPKNKITQKCSKLMEKCMNDSSCPMGEMARKYGEEWHGFLVKMVSEKFVIELPFNKDGKGYTIEIKTSEDDREFFLNLGDEKIPEKAFITLNDVNSWDVVKDNNDSEAYEQHEMNRDNAMPINAARHLWALAQDILPTDFSEMEKNISFFTEVTAHQLNKDICEKEDVKETGKNGLKLVKQKTYEYIDAQFLNPNAEPSPVENVDRGVKPVEGNSENSIKVFEKAGKQYVQILPGYLANTEFFLRAKVDKKANFTIVLMHGFVETNPTLGETLLSISAEFDGNGNKQKCTVKFLSENEERNCDDKNNTDKGLGIQSGKEFLLWVKISDGNVQLSLNCQPLESKWPDSLYSPNQNRIIFTGDIELYPANEEVVVEDVAKRDNEEATGKRSLNVFKMPPTDIVGEVLIFVLLEGRLMFDGVGKNDVQISFVNATNDIGTEIKINKCGTLRQDCNNCLEINFSGGYDPASKEICKNDLHLLIKLDHKEKKSSIFSDGINIASKAIIADQRENYVQVKGNIEVPMPKLPSQYTDMIFPILWFRAHSDFISRKDKMDLDEHVDIYLLRVEETLTKFNIQLYCDECYEKANPMGTVKEGTYSLLLEFDLKANNVKASSYYMKRIGSSNKERGSLKDDQDVKIGENFLLPGTPGWIRISVNSTESKYLIFLNGNNEPLLKLKCLLENQEEMRVDGIKVGIPETPEEQTPEERTEKMNVLNQLSFAPYKFKLNRTNLDNGRAMKVRISGRILPNAKMIEIFLVKDGTMSAVNLLGISQDINQAKEMLEDHDGKVLLHMRADQKRIKEQIICVGVKKFLDDDCTNTVQIMTSSGILHSLSFTIYNAAEKFYMQLDEFKPKFSAYDFSSATHLVIAGDIALEKEIEQPEEDENELPKEEEEVEKAKEQQVEDNTDLAKDYMY